LNQHEFFGSRALAIHQAGYSEKIGLAIFRIISSFEQLTMKAIFNEFKRVCLMPLMEKLFERGWLRVNVRRPLKSRERQLEFDW
jgi:hypothetical protein